MSIFAYKNGVFIVNYGYYILLITIVFSLCGNITASKWCNEHWNKKLSSVNLFKSKHDGIKTFLKIKKN